jgi:hypothetical protein
VTYKKLKSEVQYSKGMASKHCGICEHFRPPHSCVKVIGAIDRTYWCELFKRKASG